VGVVVVVAELEQVPVSVRWAGKVEQGKRRLSKVRTAPVPQVGGCHDGLG
jgi:hypothetical protein